MFFRDNIVNFVFFFGLIVFWGWNKKNVILDFREGKIRIRLRKLVEVYEGVINNGIK